MKNILITGGLGFIGSHISVELLNLNNNVYIIDNLENSNIDVYDKIKKITNKDNIKLEIFDLKDKNKLDNFFKSNNIDIIIHCAGKKSVNESIKIPLEYYNVNISILLNLLYMIDKYDINQFVFSSSATVYGNSDLNNYSNLCEDNITGINITNPYGKTKYIQEEIIKDYYKRTNRKCYILRYFNPVGCHSSGILGENPKDIPNNLMPYILRVADKNNTSKIFKEDIYEYLTIYGDDYKSKDGTCIRDFIHVCDLARAHIDILDSDIDSNIHIFNVGTGIGTSVLNFINSFKNINKVILPTKIGKRRDGDIPICVCCNKKILKHTKWKPKYDIDDIVKHSWNYILEYT